MLTCLSQWSEVERDREAWNALCEKCSGGTFFQTYDYNRIAWRNMLEPDTSNHLMVLLWKDQKNMLRAVFPFYCDRKGWLRFINDHHVDFCRALVDDTMDNHHQLIFELHGWIEQNPAIRGVMLENLEGSDILLNHLRTFQRDALVYANNEHSYVQCVPSQKPLDQLAHLPSKRRINLRNDYTRVKEGRMKIFSVAQDAFPEEILMNLRAAMQTDQRRGESWFAGAFLQTIRDCYQADLLELAILYSGEVPVSAGVNFVNRRKNFQMHYLVLYTSPEFNVPNLLYYIVEKAAGGAMTLDFGRGGYEYKIHKFKPEIRNLYRLMYAKSLLGQLRCVWTAAMYFLRRIAKKKLK